MEGSVMDLQSKRDDEVYCFACGSVIKREAEICPKCGVNQIKRRETIQAEVYCRTCGQMVKKDADFCIKCGVRQFSISTENKNGYAVTSLTFGIFCLVFSLIAITAGFVDYLDPYYYGSNYYGSSLYGLGLYIIFIIPPFILFFILGTIFGIISIAKYRHKVGIAGLILCIISIILIFTNYNPLPVLF